jgi:hypothetical protein
MSACRTPGGPQGRPSTKADDVEIVKNAPSTLASRALAPLSVGKAKDFGFIVTEEGERILHRSGVLPGEAPVGPCARRAARMTATVQSGKRVAIDVSMASEVAHGRARRRSSNIRSVWP